VKTRTINGVTKYLFDTIEKSESLTLFQGFTKEQLNAIQGPEVKKLQEVKSNIKE
jgi:hypothetical protein